MSHDWSLSQKIILSIGRSPWPKDNSEITSWTREPRKNFKTIFFIIFDSKESIKSDHKSMFFTKYFLRANRSNCSSDVFGVLQKSAKCLSWFVWNEFWVERIPPSLLVHRGKFWIRIANCAALCRFSLSPSTRGESKTKTTEIFRFVIFAELLPTIPQKPSQSEKDHSKIRL